MALRQKSSDANCSLNYVRKTYIETKCEIKIKIVQSSSLPHVAVYRDKDRNPGQNQVQDLGKFLHLLEVVCTKLHVQFCILTAAAALIAFEMTDCMAGPLTI